MVLQCLFSCTIIYNNMIHLLWPTLRPKVFLERCGEWLRLARSDIHVRVAVNHEVHARLLGDFETVVVGSECPGVCHAGYCLTRDLVGRDDDVVVFASDDFYAFQGWDEWVLDQLGNKHVCLLVNDRLGGSYRQCAVTIPIMSFGCLLKLNRILYHPSYRHLYSDQELFDNVRDLGLLVDCRGEGYPVFEHRHWYHGNRGRDHVDDRIDNYMERDRLNYESRSRLPVNIRLII